MKKKTFLRFELNINPTKSLSELKKFFSVVDHFLALPLVLDCVKEVQCGPFRSKESVCPLKVEHFVNKAK